VAVFPDRIVLKNSVDAEAEIITAIESGGSDAITQGEIVLGLSDGAAALFTKDAVGAIVTISGSGGGSGGLAFWGGGDFTTGVSDGEPADGGVFTV
tara:strand:- start:75 stop:362 length:288 start_codon:yes stop_codon:yes gene_type:complete